MFCLLSFNGQRSTGNDKPQCDFVDRCPLIVALFRALAVSIIALPFCFAPLCRANAPVMKTLSAHVTKVAADGSSIDVDFRNPATAETQSLTFHRDAQTGLSGIEKLQELRSGQVVSIDYVEGQKHRLLMRRIARVKLSGPPAGLEKFRGL